MPRVSVIIPTYNCAGFICRAINSVLSQTYNDFEIIVVDDGSVDETREIISGLPCKITYHYQTNHGLSNARNTAVSLSNGEFIAYLDADDMWLSHKLQRQVEYMDAYPECGLLHSDVIYVDEGDQLITPEWSHVKTGQLAQGNCLPELLNGCLFQVPTVMERRLCFDDVSGFDERFNRVEDYLHWIKLQLKGCSFGYINQPLAMYRMRSGSLSKNHPAMMESTIEMFRVLIEEHSLLEHLKPEDADAVCRRIALLRRCLPYHYRQQGRNDLARKQSFDLLCESPTHFFPYLELLKSMLPASLAGRLKKVVRAPEASL